MRPRFWHRRGTLIAAYACIAAGGSGLGLLALWAAVNLLYLTHTG